MWLVKQIDSIIIESICGSPEMIQAIIMFNNGIITSRNVWRHETDYYIQLDRRTVNVTQEVIDYLLGES